MTIVIGKFRKKIEWGEIETIEDDNGNLVDIDLIRTGIYDGDEYPPENHIPLFEFLQLHHPTITVKKTKEFMSQVGFTSIYVEVKDNDDFWAYTNHKCNTCKKECKQSSKVEIVTCPQYEEM